MRDQFFVRALISVTIGASPFIHVRRGYNLGSNPLNNFKESFQDGLVLCALVHKADPKLIDFKQLSPYNKEANLRLAFSILEKNFNLPNVRAHAALSPSFLLGDLIPCHQLLDVEDVLSPQPDERSMMTFIAHVFNRLTQAPEQPKQRVRLPALLIDDL